MKKVFSVLLLSLLSLGTLIAQDPAKEKKNTKLLELTGALSAGVAYNTYLAVGGIVDNHASKSYTDQKVKELMTEQKGLLGAIKEMIDSTVASGVLEDPSDIYFLEDLSKIIDGLAKQADFYIGYINDSSDVNKQKYDRQRRSNWDLIAELLGLDE